MSIENVISAAEATQKAHDEEREELQAEIDWLRAQLEKLQAQIWQYEQELADWQDERARETEENGIAPVGKKGILSFIERNLRKDLISIGDLEGLISKWRSSKYGKFYKFHLLPDVKDW